MSNKKQNFNGGYIKASQEAYDLLINDKELHTIFINRQYDGYYYIEDGKARWVADTAFESLHKFKQFYINNKALSWDEPIQINNMEDLNELPITGEEMLSDEDYITKDFKDEICKCSEFKLIYTDDKNRIHTINQPTQDNFEFEIVIKTKAKQCLN